MKKIAQLTLAGVFAFSLLAIPVAYAAEGTTSSGGASSNAGSTGEKGDKAEQQSGGESNDKDTQKQNSK